MRLFQRRLETIRLTAEAVAILLPTPLVAEILDGLMDCDSDAQLTERHAAHAGELYKVLSRLRPDAVEWPVKRHYS